MRFFEKFFGELDVVETTGEASVLCPFPHIQADGSEHVESIPSAHINPDKGTFHCKVPNCKSKKISPNGGLSEAGFLSAVQGITYGEATQIITEMGQNVYKTDGWDRWHNNLKQTLQHDSGSMLSIDLFSIGLHDEKLIDELRLGYKGGENGTGNIEDENGIYFPVFIYGEYMGACRYIPSPEEGQRKAKLDYGMPQAIFPFDLWREDQRDTYLCAGFKDAAIARKNGLNAITFTHGEGSFPKLYKRTFTGRKVYICYDNDQGGRDGARRTAMILKESGAYPYIVDISSVCAENKEDIHDFFQKYNKTANDLKEIAAAANPFSEEDYEKERNITYPLVTLQQSTSGSMYGKIVSSRVSVVSEFTETFQVPDVVKFEYREGSELPEDGGMYTLEENNIEDLLRLVDNGIKEVDIYKALKSFAGLPAKDPCIIKFVSRVNVHKAVVVDDIESDVLDSAGDDYAPKEMLMYSLGDRGVMRNGVKYRIFYKAVPNPRKNMEITGVITKVETSDSSVNAFKVNDEVLESLKCFQVQEGEEVEDKMKELFERSKAFLGPEANRPVFMATELFFHTPLWFTLDNGRKPERAYLEPMIVGESRTHKSATSKGLIEMYRLGTFVSLKNSTEAGLIGGAQNTGSGYKTRLGVIPRNNKGAVILEEFSGAPPGFISKMTDIRSSGRVRISRVDGGINAEARVRMLTISNAKPGHDGTTIALRQYPHGARVLLDLIGAAEDVARYDFFILKDEGETINPNTRVLAEAFEQEAYQNRIRWIWSRKPEQVKITNDILDFVIECSNDLNNKYGTHIQFFGREAWKKLTRVSIATAACVCSYDETGEKLIVTADHVLWAKNFLIECYDNEIFNMERYVQEERDYSKCDMNDVKLLQGIYDKHSTLILHMYSGTEFSQNQLKSVSGDRDGKGFVSLMSQLSRHKFIKWTGDRIQPSAKFREAMRSVNKTGTSLGRV